MKEITRRQFLAAVPAAALAAPAAISITKLESPTPPPSFPIPLPDALAAKLDWDFLGQPHQHQPVIEELQDFVRERFRVHAPNACFFRISDNVNVPFVDARSLNYITNAGTSDGINADTYRIEQVFTCQYRFDIDDIWPRSGGMAAKRPQFLRIFDSMAHGLGEWAEELAKTQPAWVTKPLLYLKREFYEFEVFVWMDYLRRLDHSPVLKT